MTPAESSARFDAVVVGGGVAGLTAALDLGRAGRRVLLLERSPAVGGVVARHRVGGIDLDAGAESFAVARPSVAGLLADLGMTDRIVTPAPLAAWVRHEAGTAPLPRGALLGIPAAPWAADVRRVLGTPGSLRASVDRLLPPRVTGGTIGELARRRMGRRVLHRLVEPVVGGIHAADPSILELDTVAPGLRAALGTGGSLSAAVRTLRGAGPAPGSAVAGIDGGMAALPAALAAAVLAQGGEIRCGTEVLGVVREPGGWRMTLPGGDITVAALVLATLEGPGRALLGDAWLPAPRTTPVTLVTLVVDDARLDGAPRGTGVLVAPRAEGVRAKAMTHATAKWPWLQAAVPAGRHVLRVSFGRGGGPTSDDLPPLPDDLPAAALRDAGVLLGVSLRADDVVDAEVVRWPTALPQAGQGHASDVTRMREAAASVSGTGTVLAVVGAPVAGNGLAAVVADARATARRVIDHTR